LRFAQSCTFWSKVHDFCIKSALYVLSITFAPPLRVSIRTSRSSKGQGKGGALFALFAYLPEESQSTFGQICQKYSVTLQVNHQKVSHFLKSVQLFDDLPEELQSIFDPFFKRGQKCSVTLQANSVQICMKCKFALLAKKCYALCRYGAQKCILAREIFFAYKKNISRT